MIAVLVVALPLGGIAIYDSIWRRHCRELEVSLCRSIILAEEENSGSLQLDIEFEFEGETYNSKTEPAADTFNRPLFVGARRTGSNVLTPPSPRFLQDVGISGLEPMTDLGSEYPFFYIKIVKWIDWNTVIVDYGYVEGPLAGGGADGATYRFKDGVWEMVDAGSYWVS